MYELIEYDFKIITILDSTNNTNTNSNWTIESRLINTCINEKYLIF